MASSYSYNTLHKYISDEDWYHYIERTGNKWGSMLPYCIYYILWLYNSLKLHALPHANTTSEGFTIQCMKTIIQNMN